jgi:hypothetical protein
VDACQAGLVSAHPSWPATPRSIDSPCVIARTSIAYFTRTVPAFRKKPTSSRQGLSIRASPVRLAMTVPTSLWPFRTSQPATKRMLTAPAPLIALRANLEESFRRKIRHSVSKTSRKSATTAGSTRARSLSEIRSGVTQRLDAFPHALVEPALERGHDLGLRNDHTEDDDSEPGFARKNEGDDTDQGTDLHQRLGDGFTGKLADRLGFGSQHGDEGAPSWRGGGIRPGSTNVLGVESLPDQQDDALARTDLSLPFSRSCPFHLLRPSRQH